MPQIKSTAAIAEKWGRVTPTRTRDYEEGVRRPRRPWAESTIAAAGTYEAGILEALAEDRFQHGVAAAGDEKWQRKTLEKGPTRWAQGVQVSEDDYARGFGPYRDEIERIVLPPRGPRGSPQNLDRVRIIAEALHALRVRIQGGG